MATLAIMVLLISEWTIDGTRELGGTLSSKRTGDVETSGRFMLMRSSACGMLLLEVGAVIPVLGTSNFMEEGSKDGLEDRAVL
jgi:hypothetical protein